jgi:hypothetical protein
MGYHNISELTLNIQVILPVFPASVAPFRAAFFGLATFSVPGPGGWEAAMPGDPARTSSGGRKRRYLAALPSACGLAAVDAG